MHSQVLMAPISKCLLLALIVAALAQCVEPRSRPTNRATAYDGSRGQWRPPGRPTVLGAGRSRRPQRDIWLNAVVCATPCQNGGTCVGRNRCACPGAYTGRTCSEVVYVGDHPYKNYYPGPLASNQRRVECEPGARMPDGSTSVTLSFRDNSWFFPDGSMMIGIHQVDCVRDDAASSAYLRPDEDSPFLPSSGRETLIMPWTPCGAPCLNMGVCEPKGTCTCRPGYAGDKCEQRLCTQPRFENDIKATPVGNLQRMTFWCRSGYVSPQGDGGVTAVCEGGIWQLGGGKMLTEDEVKCTRA